MPPSFAALNQRSLLSFFRHGSSITVATPHYSDLPRKAVFDQDLIRLPPSKFATIPVIPAKLKEIFVDRMESSLRSDFVSAVSLVTNQEEIKKYAKILIQTIYSLQKRHLELHFLI